MEDQKVLDHNLRRQPVLSDSFVALPRHELIYDIKP